MPYRSACRGQVTGSSGWCVCAGIKDVGEDLSRELLRNAVLCLPERSSARESAHTHLWCRRRGQALIDSWSFRSVARTAERRICDKLSRECNLCDALDKTSPAEHTLAPRPSSGTREIRRRRFRRRAVRSDDEGRRPGGSPRPAIDGGGGSGEGSAHLCSTNASGIVRNTAIESHQPQQSGRAEHDDVIETLAARRSDKSFDECVLPWGSAGAVSTFFNVHRFGSVRPPVERMIAIPEDISRRLVPRERVAGVVDSSMRAVGCSVTATCRRGTPLIRTKGSDHESLICINRARASACHRALSDPHVTSDQRDVFLLRPASRRPIRVRLKRPRRLKPGWMVMIEVRANVPLNAGESVWSGIHTQVSR